MLAVVLLAATGCESLERVAIRADGSASLVTSVVVGRDSPLLDSILLVDYDEWTASLLEDERTFFSELFALERSDPFLDQLDAEPGPDATTFTWTRDVADLDDLVESLTADGAAADVGFGAALTGAVVSDTAAGLTLASDAVANLESYYVELFALEAPEFFTADPDLGDLEPFRGTSNTVELVLPGRIVAHDAHEVSGNTLRWTWTFGEMAGPGIFATWDPLGDPEGGFDWTGRAPLIGLGLVVLLGLGMLAVTRTRAR